MMKTLAEVSTSTKNEESEKTSFDSEFETIETTETETILVDPTGPTPMPKTIPNLQNKGISRMPELKPLVTKTKTEVVTISVSFFKLFKSKRCQKLTKCKTAHLFFSIILYLIFGGLMFTIMEQPHHKKNCEMVEFKAKSTMFDYLELHKNKMKFLDDAVGQMRVFHENERKKKSENSSLEALGAESIEHLRKLYVDFGIAIYPVLSEKLESNCLTSKHPEWTFPQAVFYSIALITTIGYGNQTPKTGLCKSITVTYSLVGIFIIGFFINRMSNTLRQKLVKNRIIDRLCQKYIERREQRNEWAKIQKRRLSVHSIKDSIGSVLATATQPTNEIFVDIKGNTQLAENKIPKPKPRKRKKSHEEQVLDMVKIRLQLFILFFIVFFIILPAGMLYLMENLFLGNKRWTFVSTLYYVIITLSTVGLGDFVPTIQPGAHGSDTTSEHQQKKLVEDHIDDDNFVSMNQQNLTLAFTNTGPFSLKETLQNSGEDLTFIPNKGYVQYKSIKDVTYTEILIHVYCMTYAMLIFVWILFGLVYMKLSSDIICETMQRKIIKRTEDFQHLKQEVKNLALQSSSLKASEKFRMLTKNLTASKIRGNVASLDKKIDNTGKPSSDKVPSDKLRNTVLPLTNPRLKPGIADLLVKIKQRNENEQINSQNSLGTLPNLRVDIQEQLETDSKCNNKQTTSTSSIRTVKF